jgi:putative DNA methylase
LRFSIIGACEMPGYLCRWERHHPKAFEALANHRYSRSTVVAETNLVSPTGRGTIPRRLEAAERALRWLTNGGLPKRTKHAYASGKRRKLSAGALVVTGSSERQLLRDGTARLVLTDPPYHDDLQYGELARLFHVWMHEVLDVPLPDELYEAVPNGQRGTDSTRYEQLVAACLAESRRALAQDGRLILTFHNKDMRAWRSLANALRTAGFRVVGLATVSAENPADHSKRGKEACLCDLVIECIPRRPGRPGESGVTVCGRLSSAERRNLIAVGHALAERVNSRTAVNLAECYASHLRALGENRVLIR